MSEEPASKRPKSNTSCVTDISQYLPALEEDGVVILKDMFTSEQLEQISRDFGPLRDKFLGLIETEPRLRVFEESNVATKSRYWRQTEQKESGKFEDVIVLEAGKGRYDLWRGFLPPAGAPADPTSGIYGTDLIRKHPTLEALMQKVMVGSYSNYQGFIYSIPGSKDQYYHRDTDTLSNHNTNGEVLKEIDDFYFTILVPITVPINLENGSTEFMIGSHRKAADEFDSCPVKQVGTVELGEALLFNGKINHRGKANNSTEDRPVLYIVYHKMWYNDNFRVGVD